MKRIHYSRMNLFNYLPLSIENISSLNLIVMKCKTMLNNGAYYSVEFVIRSKPNAY